MNKKHLIWVLPILGFLVVYLLGAFYSATFNITKWAVSTRAIIAVLGALCAILGGMLSKEYSND